MFTFNKKYFILTLVLFVTEVLIALYAHDKIIRPYIGDVLVVILIYCFFKSFLNVSVLPLAIAVLIFSFCIEFLQYLHIVDLLGLSQYKIARIVIGTSFAWTDILAYCVGIGIVLLVERPSLSPPKKRF
ncbi:MAG: DUF2809 domain-containing protein [Ferruginibacter sp.]